MEETFNFDRFRVSATRRELWADGRPVPIGPRALDLLIALLRRHGDLVSKNDLIKAVWGGAVVEDNAIAAQVSTLRRTLGDGVDQARYLQTVPGRGYRFVGDLTPVAQPGLGAETRLTARTAFARRLGPDRLRWARALVALAAVAIVVAVLWLKLGPGVSAPTGINPRVAILPLDALSSDREVRYFADGLIDEIQSTLTTNQFQAVSRDEASRLRGADGSGAIGRLGIGLLLDGSVERQDGILRVRIHLDDARRHVTLWSGDYQGAGAQGGELQAQIATRILGVLGCARRALRPVHGLSDPAALTRYLLSCDLWSAGEENDPKGMFEILQDLRFVTVHAPEFAAGHSDLAFGDAYSVSYLGLPQSPDQAAALRREAAAEARRAVALEPRSADPYPALEMLLPVTDWASRERLLRRGLSVDPNSSDDVAWLGIVLGETGRLKEATALFQRAEAGDWVFSFIPEEAVKTCEMGQSAVPLRILRKTLAVWPRSWEVWGDLIACLEWTGRVDEARAMLDDPASRPPIPVPVIESADAAFAAAKSHAPRDIARMRRLELAWAADNPGNGISIQNLSAFGFVDDAFALAAKYTPSERSRPDFLFTPLTAAMRHDPRFMQLAQRIGLMDYWRTGGQWPDFCSEPGLKYDCRAEAARLLQTAGR